MKKCSICGKEYKAMPVIIGGRELNNLEIPQCDCEYKRFEEQEKRRAEEQRLTKIKEKADEIKKDLNCPLITPLFADKTFSYYFNQPIKPVWSEEYEKNFRRCVEYAREFKKGDSGLMMIGNVGTGKTTLQACIIHELEQKGKICLLIQFSALLDLMIQACSYDAKKSIFQLYNILSQFDYVVLDDLGREKYTEKRLEIAFRIIDCLMNNKVTVSITANQECLQSLLKIPEYNAIIDRLHMMCPEKMIFTGTSFRK